MPRQVDPRTNRRRPRNYANRARFDRKTGIIGKRAREHEDQPTEDEILEWAWLMTWGDGGTDPDKEGFGATVQQFMEFFRVKTERPGEWVPFRLRPKQQLILDLRTAAWQMGECFYGIVLKTRRYGITTFTLLLELERALRVPGWRGSTIAKDEQDAEMFLGIVRQFLHQIPTWARPVEISKTKNQMLFRHGLFKESALTVYTANKGGIGRGDTTNSLHPTEPPYYSQKAKDQYSGAQPGLGPYAGNMELWEGTAKGFDKMFYPQWGAAHEPGQPARDSQFVRIFIGSHEHPNHFRGFDGVGHLEEFIDTVGTLEKFGGEEERMLFEQVLVPYFRTNPFPREREIADPVVAAYEWLLWRRLTITDKCRGELDRFHEDYPVTAEEAFRSTGSPFFNLELVRGWQKVPEKKTVRGNFNVRDGEVIWSPTPSGMWVMRQDRINRFAYCFGADTASGVKAHADGRLEGDFSTCMIAEAITGYCVAYLREHLKPGAHAWEIAKAANYYGSAPGYIERSATGDVGITIHRLEELEIGEWQAADILLKSVRTVMSDRGPSLEKFVGFRTKRDTKRPLLEMLRSYLDEEMGSPVGWDQMPPLPPVCLMEMMYYEQHPVKGTLEASQGHDDMVITGALMLKAREVILDDEHLMSRVKPQMTDRQRILKERFDSRTAHLSEEQDVAEWDAILGPGF